MSMPKYAFSVASVRARETELLDKAFYESLINCENYDKAKDLLKNKGLVQRKETVIDDLEQIKINTWEYIRNLCQKEDIPYFLIVKNDYHNLKAIIKSLASDGEWKRFIIEPSLWSADFIAEKIEKSEFYNLPYEISKTAQRAYELFRESQIMDMYIDREGADMAVELAKKSKNNFSIKLAKFFCDMGNIKTAMRLTEMKNKNALIDYCLSKEGNIDAFLLKKAILKGFDEVEKYVGQIYPKQFSTPLGFELTYEKLLSDLLSNAQRVSFGTEPLIAYYIAVELEIKRLKLILTVKRGQLPNSVARERLGEMYV